MTQPAIRALIAKWRKEADKDFELRHGDDSGGIWVYQHEAAGRYQKGRLCADELEALLAAGDAAETPPMMHREQHLASAMRKVLPPALLAEVIAHLDPLTPFVEFLRSYQLAEPPCSNCGCEERDHRGILTCRCPDSAASLSPAAPTQEDERVIPPFLHPDYVIRKAKPQPHHGIDCGCADCAIPSTAETPPATDKP